MSYGFLVVLILREFYPFSVCLFVIEIFIRCACVGGNLYVATPMNTEHVLVVCIVIYIRALNALHLLYIA